MKFSLRCSSSSRFPPVLLLFLFLPGALDAQLSVGIFPPRVEALVRAGGTARDAVALSNQSDVPVRVTVSIVDFDVDEQGTVHEYPPATRPSSMAPHLRISPLELTVAPSQRVHFRYAVTTPDEFEQLRAMVYFAAEPQAAPGESQQVMIATSMGVPFYVENRRAEPGRLEVDAVRWERVAESGDHAVLLHLLLRNEGSRNIRPTGFLQVRSAATNYAQSFDFNQDRDVVLPGHSRRLTLSFGPVPGDELFLKLRFATSARTSYSAEERLGPARD